jgi:beta-fructofuranosidase
VVPVFSFAFLVYDKQLGMALLKFLPVLALFALLFVLSNNGVEASHKIYLRYQSLSVDKVKQTHRTGYHFQPPKNWINGT